jgi:peptide/nickel transport system permease protein
MSAITTWPGARRRAAAHLGIIVVTYAATAWAALTLSFALPRMLPGDPLALLLSDDNGATMSAESRESLAAHYGLDRPLIEQYGAFVSGVLTGDLGWSISRRMPVDEAITARLPWTLALVVPSMLIASLLGFFGGMESAWHRATVLDRAFLAIASVLRGIPEYAIAVALLLTLAVLSSYFPVGGAKTPFNDSAPFWPWLCDVAWHAVLPVTTLTLGVLSVKYLTARAATIGILGQDYLLLARAKGLSTARIKYRHAAPNAVAPFLSQIGMQFGLAIGGSLFVEQVFAYPAIGSLLREAVDTRDYPLIDGCFLLLTGTVLLANLLADLFIAWLQPEVGA